MQQEHAKPGDSLAHVLKNGKLRVLKYEVKERYPFSTKFIYDFAKKNPNVLNNYKSHVRSKSKILKDQDIEYRQVQPRLFDPQPIIETLKSINPGRESAEEYHQHILGIINSVFTDRIRRPVKETPLDDGRKRIDITYDNGRKGFFLNLTALHKIKCPYIIVECKNYGKDIKNPEFDQINGRFGDTRSRFGFIACRSISDKKELLARQKYYLSNSKNYILILTDEDFINLLHYRKDNDEVAIDDYMEDKMKELVM